MEPAISIAIPAISIAIASLVKLFFLYLNYCLQWLSHENELECRIFSLGLIRGEGESFNMRLGDITSQPLFFLKNIKLLFYVFLLYNSFYY